MPLFVILRALGFLFDSAVLALHLTGTLMTQMVGEHPALSRIEIPLIMTIFYIAVTEYTVEKDSVGLFVELSDKTGIEFSNTVVTFFIVLSCITVIRNIGGIIPFYAGNFYGSIVVEKASRKFSTASENDHQMKEVSEALDSVHFERARIESYEKIIEELMDAVEKNSSYCEIDERCNCKDLDVKYLKKQDRYVEKWREMEQYALEKQNK